MEACAETAGKPSLKGLRIAIQGCGAIGEAVARVLAEAGAELLVADVDTERAAAVARVTKARVMDVDTILIADCDIVSPCAIGGVLTTATAGRVQAWAMCGAANNIVAEPEAERQLLARDILYVPDIVASAGAVIEGVSRRIMLLPDSTALIDALGITAREILSESRKHQRLATAIAHERAWANIERRRVRAPDSIA